MAPYLYTYPGVACRFPKYLSLSLQICLPLHNTPASTLQINAPSYSSPLPSLSLSSSPVSLRPFQTGFISSPFSFLPNVSSLSAAFSFPPYLSSSPLLLTGHKKQAKVMMMIDQTKKTSSGNINIENTAPPRFSGRCLCISVCVNV